jgi:hypothetical protein
MLEPPPKWLIDILKCYIIFLWKTEHSHTHRQTHTDRQTQTHTDRQTQTHTHRQTQTHRRMRTRARARTHAHTHTHMIEWLINWKGYGNKGSQPNLRYYLSICPEILRKTMKNLNDNNLSLDQDLNSGSHKHKAPLPTTRIGHSVHKYYIQG